MEEFLTFFETISSGQKALWIFGVLGIMTLFEFGFPLVRFRYKRWRHTGVNLIFLLTTMLINLMFGFAIAFASSWQSSIELGLLYLIDFPVWIELLLAIMVFDLIAQYFVHYLLHKVSFMWRFHMVHHSDTHVDATTGTRHHPGDYVMRELFGLIALLLLGAPFAYYVFYKITVVFFTYLTHANIRMPLWLDKTLVLVFITPNMHKFHHHFERPWTDTNFGNIFSFWDRIFGTMVQDDPSKVEYGLDVADGTKDENLAYQFGLPFNKDIKTDY